MHKIQVSVSAITIIINVWSELLSHRFSIHENTSLISCGCYTSQTVTPSRTCSINGAHAYARLTTLLCINLVVLVVRSNMFTYYASCYMLNCLIEGVSQWGATVIIELRKHGWFSGPCSTLQLYLISDGPDGGIWSPSSDRPGSAPGLFCRVQTPIGISPSILNVR